MTDSTDLHLFAMCDMLCGRHVKCIMNASGCLCMSKEELDDLKYNSWLDAIVTKSGTLVERQAHPKPNLYVDTLGSINSIGLSNPGYLFYNMYNYDGLYIQSLHPFDPNELDEMLNNVTNHIELNVSCPNVNRTTINLGEYLKVVEKHKRKIGIKLPVLFYPEQFDDTSSLLLKYRDNVDFITCCNSIPNGLLVDNSNLTTRIVPNNGLGGIGGSYIKPLGLSNVYNFYRRLGDSIDIIGCGGISTGDDVYDYILCGAKAVQIGTQFLREGVGCFKRIGYELLQKISDNHYSTILEFRGILAKN